MSRRKKSFNAEIALTERALADVAEIESYSVQHWGRKAADRYLDEISAALDRLKEQPDILRLEPDIATNLFFYRVRKHVLVCDLRGKTITVLTVVHTSMDLPARLLELEPRIVPECEFLQNKLQRKSKSD